MDDYEWALRQMQSLYQDFSVQHPRVIVTDRDLGMLEAIRRVFPPPQTGNLLCLWHINKNVLTRVTKIIANQEH